MLTHGVQTSSRSMDRSQPSGRHSFVLDQIPCACVFLADAGGSSDRASTPTRGTTARFSSTSSDHPLLYTPSDPSLPHIRRPISRPSRSSSAGNGGPHPRRRDTITTRRSRGRPPQITHAAARPLQAHDDAQGEELVRSGLIRSPPFRCALKVRRLKELEQRVLSMEANSDNRILLLYLCGATMISAASSQLEQRIKIAELKQICNKPDVPEVEGANVLEMVLLMVQEEEEVKSLICPLRKRKRSLRSVHCINPRYLLSSRLYEHNQRWNFQDMFSYTRPTS